MRRLTWAVCMASLILAGCESDPTTDPTVSTAPSSAAVETHTATPTPTAAPTPTPVATTPPTSAPTFAPTATIPEELSTIADDGEVTLAEAQAVLDIQTTIYNDAVITLITRPEGVTGAPSLGFNEQLARVFSADSLDFWSRLWIQEALDGFVGFNLDDPAGEIIEAIEVVHHQQDCVIVETTRDASGFSVDPTGTDVYWIGLTPQDSSSDLTNDSGWKRFVQTSQTDQPSLCDLVR